MKKNLTLLAILFAMTIFLSACGDDTEPVEDTTPTESEDNTTEDTSTEEGTDPMEEDESSTDENEDSSTSKGNLTIDAEDQLDLGIGDTGTFDTTLGTYTVALDSAELIEDELDGEGSELDYLLLLDLTINNKSDESLQVEELVEDLEVTTDLESTGYTDYSDYFSSLVKLEGEIQPGENFTGQFITDVKDAEEYYFRKKVGNVEAGTSNQVIWTIPASEAQ